MNIKKLLFIIFVIGIVGGIISYLFYQQKQPLTKATLKKQMLTVESTLLEASLLTQVSYDGKTTAPYLKTYTQELAKQLQQSENLLRTAHPTPEIQQQTQHELQLISQARQTVQTLSDNPHNSVLIKKTQTKLVRKCKEQQSIITNL